MLDQDKVKRAILAVKFLDTVTLFVEETADDADLFPELLLQNLEGRKSCEIAQIGLGLMELQERLAPIIALIEIEAGRRVAEIINETARNREV